MDNLARRFLDCDILPAEKNECSGVDEHLLRESEDLEEYFKYIEKLSKEDLLLILKWEVSNRIFSNLEK